MQIGLAKGAIASGRSDALGWGQWIRCGEVDVVHFGEIWLKLVFCLLWDLCAFIPKIDGANANAWVLADKRWAVFIKK